LEKPFIFISFLLWKLNTRLAIVDAFDEWCHLLEGAQHEIIVNPNDTTFLCQFFEDFKTNLFIIGI